jgi:hypothetical protein
MQTLFITAASRNAHDDLDDLVSHTARWLHHSASAGTNIDVVGSDSEQYDPDPQQAGTEMTGSL